VKTSRGSHRAVIAPKMPHAKAAKQKKEQTYSFQPLGAVHFSLRPSRTWCEANIKLLSTGFSEKPFETR
jgi:hypothetical protein